MTAPSLSTIASRKHPAYSSPVVTLLATGCRNLKISRRNSAQITTAGVFFRPQLRVMAAVCGRRSRLPGAYYPGIPTPHTAATQSRRKDGGGSNRKVGATPMNHIHTALKNRAAAHKAMAFAALRADSSASVRLGRYRKHIDRSRALLALAVLAGGEA